MRLDTNSGAPHIARSKPKLHNRPAPDRHLCADGGLSVRAWNRSTLTLTNPQIRALDLVDCPEMVEVDLRCSRQSEVHLSVRGCLNLRIIRLPARAVGILHIDAGSQPPQIEINGGVALVDACWHGGRFSKQARVDTGWSRVLIAPISQPEQASSGAERILRVITGTPGDALRIELQAPDDAPWDYLLTGMRKLEQLCCQGSALNSLEVLDAPKLADIELQAHVRHLLLKNCPSLHRLHGGFGGQQLDLHERSGDPSGLAVDLPYPQATIADSRIARLSFMHVTSLSLLRCYEVRHAHLAKGSQAYCEGYLPSDLAAIAEFGIDESSIRHHLNKLSQGDLDAWRGFRGVLTAAKGTEMVAKALRGLAEAMHLGIDPAEVWQTRLELYARHRDRTLKANHAVAEASMAMGKQSWAWKMAPDLAADGWRAEWLIWRHCVEAGVTQAIEALPAMGADLLNRNDVIPHLMPWLIRSPQIDWPQTVEFLIRLLTLAAKQEKSGFASGDIGRELRLMMRPAMSATQASLRRQELALKVRAYLVAVLPADELLVLLSEWLATEPGSARTKILQLAADPPSWQRLGQMSTTDFRRAARTLILTGRLPVMRPTP